MTHPFFGATQPEIAQIRLPVASPGAKELYLLTADSLDSAELQLNGTVLRDDDGASGLARILWQSSGSKVGYV